MSLSAKSSYETNHHYSKANGLSCRAADDTFSLFKNPVLLFIRFEQSSLLNTVTKADHKIINEWRQETHCCYRREKAMLDSYWAAYGHVLKDHQRSWSKSSKRSNIRKRIQAVSKSQIIILRKWTTFPYDLASEENNRNRVRQESQD